MTWSELERVASEAICSELGNIPKTMAERVARRIVEDVKIELVKDGEGHGVADGDTVAGIRADVVEAVDEFIEKFRPKLTPQMEEEVLNNRTPLYEQIKRRKM